MVKRCFAWVLTLVLAGGAGSALGADSLSARLNALLLDADVKGARVGLDVMEVTANGPVVLFSHGADVPLTPASNVKILTTAAAFERYGAKGTFKTRLFKVGDDLVIVGSGDPGFGDEKILAGQSLTKDFDAWAAILKQGGVTTFRHLLIDDRVFDTQFVHPNWPADQRLQWYEAPVGGLNFNANCLDWSPKLMGGGVGVELTPANTYTGVTVKAVRGASTAVSMMPVGSGFEMRGTVSAGAASGGQFTVPIADPGLWTGTILRDRLVAAGITQTGQVGRVNPQWQVGGQLVATAETPVMSVIQRANTNSLNMMAEGLCKRLGHDASGEPGSWANGTAAVMAFTKGLKVPEGMVTLDDGSGLSREDKVSARAFTMVLAHAAAKADGDAYVGTFATPGTDGTLRKRFREAGGAAAGECIHAKTGHITDVSTLSGYMDVGGRRFAFSILCNGYKKTSGNVNPWQDKVCIEIYKWARQ